MYWNQFGEFESGCKGLKGMRVKPSPPPPPPTPFQFFCRLVYLNPQFPETEICRWIPITLLTTIILSKILHLSRFYIDRATGWVCKQHKSRLFTTACLPFREKIIISLAFNLLKLGLTSAFGALNYPTKERKPRDFTSSLKIIFSANSGGIWDPLLLASTPIDIIYSAPTTTHFCAVLYIVNLNCKRSWLKVWQLQIVVSLTLNSNLNKDLNSIGQRSPR